MTLPEPFIDGEQTTSANVVTTPQVEVRATGAAPCRSISEVYDLYVADPKHNWSKRTSIAHAPTKRWVVEAFGESAPITGITREGCREFVREHHVRGDGVQLRESVPHLVRCGVLHADDLAFFGERGDRLVEEFVVGWDSVPTRLAGVSRVGW